MRGTPTATRVLWHVPRCHIMSHTHDLPPEELVTIQLLHAKKAALSLHALTAHTFMHTSSRYLL